MVTVAGTFSSMTSSSSPSHTKNLAVRLPRLIGADTGGRIEADGDVTGASSGVGGFVDSTVGSKVGEFLDSTVGPKVGEFVDSSVGPKVGEFVESSVGPKVGDVVSSPLLFIMRFRRHDD